MTTIHRRLACFRRIACLALAATLLAGCVVQPAWPGPSVSSTIIVMSRYPTGRPPDREEAPQLTGRILDAAATVSCATVTA